MVISAGAPPPCWQALGLAPEQWTASFQSRFGKEVAQALHGPDRGRIALSRRQAAGCHCPAFPGGLPRDPGEIQVQNREIFHGRRWRKRFEYIPALNSDQAHIRMMVSLICRELA
jgi:ferrochelatase